MRFAALLLLAFAVPASSADFLHATYDAERDELQLTLVYRGTNPDHDFSLEWDECRKSADAATYEIAGRVLDDQWNDPARESFTKTIRFPLSDLRCRPAEVTLFTEPNFRIGLFVPDSTQE